MTIETLQRRLAILVIGLSVGLLGACEDQGPAEEVGEAVDETAEDAGEAIEEAGEEAKDAAN